MKKKYNLTLTIEHPIIKNHMVFEQNLLPGLAYIDMLYQLAQDGLGMDYDKHSLKHLTIYNPLIVEKDRPVRLEILFNKVSDYWNITVQGTETDTHGNSLPEKLYITAKFYEEKICFEEQIDIEAMKEAARQRLNLDVLYEEARKLGLVHQEMIKAKGNVYLAGPICLVEVNVDDACHDKGKKVLFHPALIDGAAIAAGAIENNTNTGNNEDLYIPLYYESFSCIEPLDTLCYAVVRSESLNKVNDVRTMDISFFTTAGKQVAQLKGITGKRIRFREQIKPVVKTESISYNIQENPVLPEISPQHLIETTSKHMEAILRKIFSSYLNQAASQIDINRNFFEIGLESSQLLSIVKEIENSFNLSLSPILLFENNNIRELIDSIKTKVEESGCSHYEPVKKTDNKSVYTEESLLLKQKGTESRDIAIIGLSGRYPGARNIQELWSNLKEGRDCIAEIPEDRWDHSLYFDEDKSRAGKTYCRWGGFLDDVDHFDPLFFNISPREAEIMDPMDRLFLETVWNLLENAGYTREALQRQYQSSVGVYVGAMYQQYHFLKTDIIRESAISLSSYSTIANRVSYFFNLQGPSIAIDTACSSSAIAIHMACESLTNGDCKMAIAGGINLSIHPKKYLGLSLNQMIGSHYNSRSFGDGDGFLPAEGVGAVLLKPLTKAINDGDSILAVIKSTATNHGGHASGFNVPNPNAQAQLIENNFIKSGIDPRTISYVEAAANGSALGDPIEIAALNKAFQKFTCDRQFCAIGSVKSNIGHAEAASGISQLTKVILQLQHKQLVPSIKAEPLNSNICFQNTPFYLQQELQEWKRPVVEVDGEKCEFPRRTAISSFGAGGSNAHLIIEEYIPSQKGVNNIHYSASLPQMVVFSAKNQNQLVSVIQQMLDFLELRKDISILDIAYTLLAGREAMESRLAMVVSSREELIQGMKGYLDKEKEACIPTFTGDMEEHSKIRGLLSGKLGETLVQKLLEEKDLEKIALDWTQGGFVPLESLYEGQQVLKIPLPTYPFEKRRCWIQSSMESGLNIESDMSLYNSTSAAELHASLPDRVIVIITRLLGLTVNEFNTNASLDKYGIDSIVFMSIFQQLKSQVDSSITFEKLRECKTTQDIINILPTQNLDKRMSSGQQARNSAPATWPQFPELIHLNQSTEGRAVFWFHGGLGGVEIYHTIAHKIQRPFYGIQARGGIANRSPLYGIQAMASYYVHIIQSVQPEGPYDLGGYSLGGNLAYEVTRQLQELGQTVHTIVMLDSIDSTGLKKINLCEKTMILQAVNTALVSANLEEPEKIAQVLIHKDEVNPNVDDEEFFKQVIMLARSRGLDNTEAQLYDKVQQNKKVQDAYEASRFRILALPDSKSVTCYYFRNKSGLLLGELEPYYSIEADDYTLDHVNYWEEWKQQFPNLHMMDVDSSNHMTLLLDSKPLGVILDLCEKLYSGK